MCLHIIPDRTLDLRPDSSQTIALFRSNANVGQAAHSLDSLRYARFACPSDIVAFVDTTVDVAVVDLYVVGIVAVACVAAAVVQACRPFRPSTVGVVLFLVASTDVVTDCRTVAAAGFLFLQRFELAPVSAVCRADPVDRS